MFAFVGIEVALIPSGEVKNPARTVPRSAYLALVITTIIYIMIQLVAQGTLGADLANHPERAAGRSGREISRQHRSHHFARGRDHLRVRIRHQRYPQFAANALRVRPRRRVAGVVRACPSALSLARRRHHHLRRDRLRLVHHRHVRKLAVLSNVAVLLMYLLCCAACWFLVQRDVRADGPPFNFPGMKIVPALAIIAIIWILARDGVGICGERNRAGDCVGVVFC